MLVRFTGQSFGAVANADCAEIGMVLTFFAKPSPRQPLVSARNAQRQPSTVWRGGFSPEQHPEMKEVFGFDCYSPKEIAERVENVGVTKANLPLLSQVALGVLAGGFIG